MITYETMSAPNKSVGNLQSRPLVEILLWIKKNAYTGVLVLARDQVKKSIITESGKVVAVKSNLANETLVHMLLNLGKIQSKDVRDIIEKIENKEAYQQGEELMKAGLISSTTLFEVLQSQMEQRILEIFDWIDGKYGMVPELPENIIKVPMDKPVPELCFRGLMKKYSQPTFKPTQSEKDIPIKTDGDGVTDRDLKILGKELGVYRSINGIASIEQIAKSQGVPILQAQAVLTALKDFGMLKFMENKSFDHKPTTTTQKSNAVLEVKKLYELNKNKDFFEILGVPKKANEKDIKSAYFDLAKKYHPDRVAQQLLPEDKKIVEDYFSLITQAHNTLSNPNQKKEYEASLFVEDMGISSQQAEKILQSEMLFQKALLVLKKANYEEVIRTLQEAIGLYDQEPEYKLHLGWAMFRDASLKKDGMLAKKGKELVKFAMEKNQKLIQGYYYLGMIDKSESKNESARKNFEKVLELNPHHMEAATELKVLEMKDAKKEPKGGILGLFGKKK